MSFDADQIQSTAALLAQQISLLKSQITQLETSFNNFRNILPPRPPVPQYPFPPTSATAHPSPSYQYPIAPANKLTTESQEFAAGVPGVYMHPGGIGGVQISETGKQYTLRC